MGQSKIMKYEFRKLTLDDAENLAKAANNPKVARYLRNVFPCPYSLQDAIDFINFATDNEDELIYGIIVDGKASGCICARFGRDVFEKTCSLGYWLGEEYCGKGVMTNAVKEFCEFIFANYEIIRIDSGACAENIGSRRVLEKAGFKFEGLHEKSVYKNGCVMDTVTYALLKD